MQGKYEALKLPHRFVVIHGAGHGGKEFFDAERMELIRSFLATHLK